MLRFLENSGDYFSQNFFGEDFPKKVFAKSGFAQDHIKEYNSKIGALREKYFQFKNDFLDLRRTKDQVYRGHQFHTLLLNALGYESQDDYDQPVQLNENEVIPVRKRITKSDSPYLYIMEMAPMIQRGDEEPLGIFEQVYQIQDWEKVLGFKENGLVIKPDVINEALSELFLLESSQRPEYVIMLAAPKVFLIQYEKWLRGSYLLFDLEELFSESQVTANRNHLALLYALLGRKQFINDTEAILKSLDEDSHKAAYAVTSSLKNGVIYAVEAIANEAIHFKKAEAKSAEDHQNLERLMSDPQFARELKDECLTIVYRLLFLFYAEAREDLEILPVRDEVYNHGYSLEMLRELEMVPLVSESARNGRFFSQSLWKLFDFLYRGVVREDDQESFILRPLDSPLFDNGQLVHLRGVHFRNYVLQEIVMRLSLSERTRKKGRGRISYANLGINQLGSVYESLLAFSGYFASEDLIEVKRADDPTGKEGTFLVARSRRDAFEESEILKHRPSPESEEEDVLIPKGTFVYRLNGRDRQKSASYYTPEVLTECTVKYTLKNILEKLRDRQKGGEECADEILHLKLLEPAMGAAAFHNEVINQLSVAYLELKENEVVRAGDTRIPPANYADELQKVKAYIAANNVYGVDINPTAVELGKLSLWLNAMHRNMETPFFAHRLGTGNAVVGAWLKVYKESDVLIEFTNQAGTKWEKKEWWEQPPKRVKWDAKGRLNRKENEIYHFLLPDKNMLPSAGIKMLKADHPEKASRITTWRKEFIKPLTRQECHRVRQFSQAIDLLLEEHYQQTARINHQTASHYKLYGQKQEQTVLEMDYHQKEALANSREAETASFFKLKTIMDYWCSLWFWDMRKAESVPSRQEWYDEVDQILNLDLTQLGKLQEQDVSSYTGFESQQAEQLSLLAEPKQLSLGSGAKRRKDERQLLAAIASGTTGSAIFSSSRVQYVQELAATHRFFHYELEFTEVFKERGGFDVAVGNPPWMKVQFEEKDIFSEVFPELQVRKTSAPMVRNAQDRFFVNQTLKETYLSEFIGTESLAIFMNAKQNFTLLEGQQNNLYKSVLESGLSLISRLGFLGLLHPETIYDDPKGQQLRRTVFRRLEFHFHFRNAFKLFQEVHHQQSYSSNVYAGFDSDPNFLSISNVFLPHTIEGCFIHDGNGVTQGIKVKDNTTGEFVWNVVPHKSRAVRFRERQLRTLARTFEGTEDWTGTKLINIHASEIMSVLEKLGQFPTSVKDYESKITQCWDETNDLNAGQIRRHTKYPNVAKFEMIYSGPHFYVANPLYKSPIENCVLRTDYDTLMLDQIDDSFVPRTNYVQTEEALSRNSFAGFVTGNEEGGQHRNDSWLDYYKAGFRKMLNQPGERTLTGALLMPNATHVNGVISITFRSEEYAIELIGISASIILDFYMKSIGTANLTDSRLQAFPLGIRDKQKSVLFVRTLQLNCLNRYYADLWERHWQEVYRHDSWHKPDHRLKPFGSLAKEWKWETPLRNWYERRMALVEIDVITSMALNLTLEELILIYNVQFPVLQQNEDDTWYDRKGNIVFTCSKGLTGVGLDRKDWNDIKDMKEGTYVHTIDPKKSELYGGQQITYYAPFDKCDRVEDYKRAWKHFEERFLNVEVEK